MSHPVNISEVENQLTKARPSICYSSVIGNYFDGNDFLIEDTISNEDYWNTRFVFLLLVLAAEGEL